METKTQLELVEPYLKGGDHATAWFKACEHLREAFPIRAGLCAGVKYEARSDRYVATFSISKQTCSMRVTNEVAQYLLAALSRDRVPSDCWLKMNDDGAIDDCLLVTL